MLRVVVAVIGAVLFVLVLVVNRVTGLIGSALVVWAAWTHRVSAIPGWALSSVIVGAAIFLFLLSVATPRPVKDFLWSVRVGLVVAAAIALATAQWFPAVALGIGAVLAGAVEAAAKGVEVHEREHPYPPR
jgi:hypothetical protein